jgi:teichoic acid transport system ATP-binding protein
MSNANAIQVQSLTKIYRLFDRHVDRIKETFHPLRRQYHRDFIALDNVSMEIERGQTVGIIGRNGSGKSTLLQIICGILQPTEGAVDVSGRVSALLELGAGFNPDFTGRQNVYINAAILGLTHEEIEQRLPEIEAFANIGDFIDQPVRLYSSGMYVRLAFATAINVNPEILIVDEALSVGDTLFQAKCFEKFREFQQKGVTILFVTHALDLVSTYCAKAYLLDAGKLLTSGSPKRVIDEYNRFMVSCGPLPGHASSNEKQADEPETVANRAADREGENRYGDGRARIRSGGIFDKNGEPAQVLVQGDTYEFRMEVEFYATIKDPIMAFTIKDVKGFDITGTNTMFKKTATGMVHDGDLISVTFSQTVPLNPGGYLISFGCTGYEEGIHKVYDRRYDMLSFQMISHRASVGLFDLNSEVYIRKG